MGRGTGETAVWRARAPLGQSSVIRAWAGCRAPRHSQHGGAGYAGVGGRGAHGGPPGLAAFVSFDRRRPPGGLSSGTKPPPKWSDGPGEFAAGSICSPLARWGQRAPWRRSRGGEACATLRELLRLRAGRPSYNRALQDAIFAWKTRSLSLSVSRSIGAVSGRSGPGARLGRITRGVRSLDSPTYLPACPWRTPHLEIG